MNDLDLTDGPADPELDELDELLIVPPRKGTSGALMPAIALMLIALTFLLVRSRLADWRGFEPKSLVASRPVERPEPIPAAVPEKPSPLVPTPPRVSKPAPKPVAKAEAAVVATVEAAAPKVDPMAEIEREAEKKRQEKEELERLKTDADNALANAPPAPHPGPVPLFQRQQAEAAIARHHAAVERMMADARQRHERMFNDMLARQRAFHRQIPQGFGIRGRMMPFGGMAGAEVPAPPVPQFPEDEPNDRQVRERHGNFILPGGGRGQWQSTVIIIQRPDGGFQK